MMMRILLLSFTTVFVGAFTSTAWSQQDQNAQSVAATAGLANGGSGGTAGWRNQWGLGVIANPKFAGGDEYNITPVPYFDFRYMDAKGTRFFANVPQGIGGYLYRQTDAASGRFLNLGGSIAPGFTVRDDSIPGLDEVGVATEARLILEAGSRRWSASATLAQDVGSGHEGAYLDLNISRRGRLGSGSGFYAVGPVLRLGDSTYKDALFGVSAADSAGSGLAPFDAEAGIERVGIQGLVSLPLGKSAWRVTGILRASQLLDTAADSPLVVDETQLFFLTAITRPF